MLGTLSRVDSLKRYGFKKMYRIVMVVLSDLVKSVLTYRGNSLDFIHESQYLDCTNIALIPSYHHLVPTRLNNAALTVISLSAIVTAILASSSAAG